MRTSLLTLGLLAALGPALALAQRNATIPDPDPEVERRSFKVADGFEVNLFAADPLLAKPIQMNFDAAGRLWLACSETYPQIKPGQKANDKVLVLEDSKGVGKADKVTVFADGLLIPTGVEPGDGGAYVANSTDLVHLADSNGDGKADRRRVVLSGFGTEDTHHILHTLRWGHDGNLYFNQSVYIHSHIETPHGVRRLNAGGVWQFRPDTQRLEVYLRGLWNTWGHHFDRHGQSLLTDGAGGQGVYYGFPGAAYDPTPEVSRTLKGLNPGSPKYCGLEIVSGRHLPDDWQGSLITCDFRAHRVCRFVLAPSGSGYTARLMPDVIRASHPAFRPIDVKMGPDGALYVADWYNPIIQHGEVDFRDPRRDVTRGRIWRITARGRPTLKRPDLTRATPEALVAHLESPEGWTRHFARRVLKDRGADAALPALDARVKALAGKGHEAETQRLDLVWAYQTLDVVRPDLLRGLLAARDDQVRAAAVRVLSAWHERIDGAIGLLEPRVADENARVRLEAVRALAGQGTARAAEIALRALDRPLDDFLDYGLWLTLRELEPHWLPALQKGRFDFGGNVQRLAFALQAVGSQKIVGPLSELARGTALTPEGQEGVLTLLAGVGGAGELALVVQKAVDARLAPGSRARLLGALEEAARQRGVRAAGERKPLLALLQDRDDRVQAAAARLLGLYQVAEARPSLQRLAADPRTATPVQTAAVDGLAALGGQDSVRTLEALAEKADSLPLRRRALIALSGLDLATAARKAAAHLAGSADGAGEVIEAFIQRKSGADLLARALADHKLPADVAKVGVRTVRTSGREAPLLLEALTRAGGLTAPKRTLTPAEMQSLVAEVAARGNPERGEQVFRRAEQLCLKCHAVGGSGGQVGPDLSSIGASAQVDYLIDSLLQPSKAIKENYHATLVTTSRGQQLTGIKVRQTDNALVLRDDQDRETAVPLREIEEQGPSKISLMPEGLTDTLTRAELIDLVRFLSELGKGERFSVGTRKLARRWQVLVPTAEVQRLLGRQGMGALAGPAPGLTREPAYSSVAGTLGLDPLPTFRPGNTGPRISVVQTALEAGTPSKVTLVVGPPRGLTAWLNGELLPLRERFTLDLTAGVHSLVLAVNREERADGVRLELEDSPAAAAVRFVSGK